MIVTERYALDHLKALCALSSQKQVAEQMGISPQYLNDLLFRRRDLAQLNPHALAAVGLRKQVTVSWDLEMPVESEPEKDTPEQINAAVQEALAELQRLRALRAAELAEVHAARQERIDKLEIAIELKASVRHIRTAIRGWDPNDPPIKRRNSFA